MSGYSLYQEITPANDSDTVVLPNIVANQTTKIAVITSDLNSFSPIFKVYNPSNIEVARSSVDGNSDIATFTSNAGGTFKAIVNDDRGAAKARTGYTVEVNLEPNELNNKRDADTPAVNPGTSSGWVGQIDPVDNYRIQGPGVGKLTATLTNLDGNVTVTLFDSKGSVIGSPVKNAGQPGAKLEADIFALNERYFLQVAANTVLPNGFGSMVPGLGKGDGKNDSSQYTLNLAFVTSGGTGPGPIADPSTPVTIATPTINASDPGNPTGQSANTVSGLFYNLSDSNDNISLSSLPPAAAGKQILALSGNDNITGTSGADTVNGMQGADTIDGGAGNDSLSGGKGSDSLDGGAGDDQILGGNDNDTLTGGEGNDTIRGGKENDVLIGGNGDDLLYGDRNQDFLTGGSGNDTFVLAGGSVAAAILKDADVIVDFTAGDKIGLTDGNIFGGLTFEDVSLTLNGQSAVNSTAIKAGSSYLGIVQGVARSALTANVFVIL